MNEFERPTRIRWYVVLTAGLLALTIYLHRSASSPARTTILRDFQERGFKMDDAVMGDIQAAFSWGYLFQIVGGIAGARFGNRIALTFFALATSLAMFGSGVAVSPSMLFWMTFWIGVAQAGIIPCVSQLLKDWMPASRRGISSGIFTASMGTGAALANYLTGKLLKFQSWRTIYIEYALVGVMWSIWFALWFRNRPADHPQVNDAERRLIEAGQTDGPASPSPLTWRVWAAMFLSWNQWMNCLQQFFRNFFYTFFITGFPAFLEYAYHVDVEEATKLASIPLISSIAGVLAGGQLIDYLLSRTGSKWISRSGLAMIGHVICGVAVLAASRAPNVELAVALIGFGIFFFGFGSPCTWAMTMDIAGKNTSSFIAVSNMVGVFAGISCPKIVGQMFVQAKAGEIGWNQIFFLFAGINLAAALCWLTINPKPARIPGES